nr:NADH-quinone oxidoreductase subunit M [Parachlamydiaceae bacterium]
KRYHAALKFLIYMIAGSTLMVAAVLGLYFAHASVQGVGSFNFHALGLISQNAPYAAILAGIFFLAFAVKTPLFPFHAWLPEAYGEAPMGGTILLSALLSKAGIYGFLRIGGEIFPGFMQAWAPLFIGLAIAGVFYGAFAAWSQNDFKRLLAYSSFSHVNFVLVGIFVWSQMALSGAILQALNHGLTITALFLVAGWLQERVGSTSLGQVSGLARYLPHLCWLTLFFVLSSIALPGLNNFIGEFLIFLGLFTRNHWVAAGLALIIVFSVIYMLRWMEKMYFGEPTPQKATWKDISARELATALPLAAIMLLIGIYPTPLIDQYINPSAEQIIATEVSLLKSELPQ